MTKLTLVLSILLLSESLFGQTPDTILIARNEANQNNFLEADKMLTQYNLHHLDINALRLHAQVLYWMKDFKRSADTYETTLAAFPNAAEVKLDYGNFLFATGKLAQAQQMLVSFQKYDNKNVEGNILLAQLYYWDGNIALAREKLEAVLQPYPNNATALNILGQINATTAPYLSIRGIYKSDDQPIQPAGGEIEIGKYINRLLSPTFLINYSHFTLPDNNFNSMWVQVGNKLSIGNGRFSAGVTGGLFTHQGKERSTTPTVNLLLTQKLSKILSLEANIAERPYQFTSASIRTLVMQTFSGIAINFNQSNNWLGRAAYQIENFKDDNKIQTAYLWLLAPLVSRDKFSIKAGYGFNYANADVNNFVPATSLSTTIQNTAVGASVKGIYEPYFTPSNQISHSVLASLSFAFSPKVNFNTRVNIAFSATADNPYLILNKSQNNVFSIDKSYGKFAYTPVDFQNELSVKLSGKLLLSGTYGYSRFLFYTVGQGVLHLRYNFIHAK